MNVLVTGSTGLVGSAAVEYYDERGHDVCGIDNNMRKTFFGDKGDTTWNVQRLQKEMKHYTHVSIDIRDREKIVALFKRNSFDMVIHCAAQPSHDKAADVPFLDFEVNANGTLNLLEATRQFCPEAVFIHMSTNKVYGDAPNELPLKELETRYDYEEPDDYHGISETCSIDQCLHSLFGASKTAGDVIAQEYGRYFGMKVGIFRAGCLTGPSHSGVELHGFLSYLVKIAVTETPYTVFGYKGKQVRDNLHSVDVIHAFDAFYRNPRPGEVYNLGGGRENSVSMLEAINKIEALVGKKINWTYDETNRIGDHICYISDLRKLKEHFVNWSITRTLDATLSEMVDTEMERVEHAAD